MSTIVPGTKVRIAGDIPAVVTAVTVREFGVACYEVVWWGGTTRNCAWVEPGEVTPDDGAEPPPIGFLSGVLDSVCRNNGTRKTAGEI